MMARVIKPQTGVIGYDCRAGAIERYARGAKGEFRIEAGKAVRETLTGDVTVRWREERPE
jgi:hypothetical protein